MVDESEGESQEGMGEILKTISDTNTIENLFSEPSRLLHDVRNSYETGNYTQAIEKGRQTLGLLNEHREKFEKVGLAFSIAAADAWLSNFKEAGVDISGTEDLLTESKSNFRKGDFTKTDKGLEEVTNRMSKLQNDQINVARKSLETTRQFVENIKMIGANVTDAENILAQAIAAFEDNNYVHVARLTSEAKENAKGARKNRIQAISEALLITRSLIDETKNVGVDITEPEEIYNRAKAAFDADDYKKCQELNREAEQLALELQDAQIAKVMQLKGRRDSGPVGGTTVSPAGHQPQAGYPTQQGYTPPTTGYGAQPQASGGGQCQNCGSQMRFIQKYDRFWCDQCRLYGPKRQ